jgi:anti-sigma28 factor (negative regulator of flagellin synthesis)
VDQLKQAILNGTYQVDPKAVAGKMISHFTNGFLMP